jgi:hypothetical protein
MIKIERGIPLPKKKKRAAVYPFDLMNVGDSFLVSKEKIKAVRQAVIAIPKDGRKFVTRTMPNGLRVWRVA